MPSDLHFLSQAEASKLIKCGALSPVELCEAYLDRIDAHNDALRAFLTVTDEAARLSAQRAEREIRARGQRNPMHGLPYAAKDVYDTAGVPTTGHSALTRDRVPAQDADCISRLDRAGAVMLGKLATHEFSTGGPSWDVPWPPARNPWRLDRFPGGSSSGAGAAVAAGLAPGALGGDTGGSIRLPAAYCGLVGLKPTYGRVSKRGVLPLSWTLDNCGPLTWTVEDAAIFLQVISGHDPEDPASAKKSVPDFRSELTCGVKGLRIGWVRHFYERDTIAADAVVTAMQDAVDVLRSLGANVVEVELPSLDTFQACYRTIVMAEAFSVYEDMLRRRPEEFGASFRYRILSGALIEAADYVSALRMQRELMDVTLAHLADVDVLLTATTPGPAPVQHRMTIRDSFSTPPLTLPFNIAQCPTLSLCNGFSADGMPLSMQIAGRPFDEACIIGVAAAYERETSWRSERPALLSAEEPESAPDPEPGGSDDAVYAMLAERIGLDLPPKIARELAAVMPLTDEIVEAVRATRPYGVEPGTTFRLPAGEEMQP